uniref:OBP45 n=1 Tax=Episyrphus balteatus TaxID=286459 RepID=A0A6H0D688_EPIBA|nr:OBP45 [Episyrphus balteatus]
MLAALASAANNLQMREDCARELQIKNYQRNTIPEGHLGKCFMKCMYEKNGVYDKENGFNIEKIYNEIKKHHSPRIAEGELLGLVENCVKESNKADDPCERVYRSSVCFDKLD